MLKTLIYYVSAGGDKYYQQTLASIRSLRELGRYTGAVAVITDQPALFSDVIVVHMAQVMPAKPEGVSPGVFITNAKPMILRAVPRLVEYHDFTLYLDSDTLVVSPRFRFLVEGMCRIGGVWVQQNYWTSVAHGKHVNQGSQLDPALFRMCPNLSVCSGMVGFGADAYDALEAWRGLSEKNNCAYDDQALLHIACAQHNEGRVHYIPRHDVWFPTNRIHSPCIYHFTHQGVAEQQLLTSLLFPSP